MRILVTNDDGIHSEGLDVCAEIGRALSEDVWVIAPEFDQSGVSHSLSLNDPLRLREVGERRFAVKGTPTDCVIMGSRHVIKDRPPNLVLSGVNRGRNAGEDVIYSGTVAGAVEGTILGIPSVALSQAYKSRSSQPPHWETAIRFAPDIIRRVLAAGIPRDVLININFPDCAPGEVKGIAVTNQGRNRQDRLQIEARQDGRGNAYYWIAYVRVRGQQPADGSDIFALAENRIAVTPLRLDMTDEPFMTKLAELFDEQDDAVKWMIRSVIGEGHKAGAKVGLCGQAPSDHPEFAEFLVACGIDSMSVSPDSFIAVKRRVAAAEAAM